MDITRRSRTGASVCGALLCLLMLSIGGCALTMGATSTPGGVAKLQRTWRYPQGILARPPAPEGDADPQWYPPNGTAMTQSKLIEWAWQLLPWMAQRAGGK